MSELWPAVPPWWVDGVIYQIYPRSFADANGDGIGDLRGVTRHLDHLEWLGVDAIWLNPITVSPNKDWGYDVADYCDVDPALGTLADFDELVARVVRDQVHQHADVPLRRGGDQLVEVGQRAERRVDVADYCDVVAPVLVR